MKPKIFNAKKLLNGYVSIRDYVITECLSRNQSILVKYEGEKMLLTPEDLLKKRVQFHGISFQSKYDSRSYTLVDYKFVVPDKPKPQEQLDLFNPTKGGDSNDHQ